MWASACRCNSSRDSAWRQRRTPLTVNGRVALVARPSPCTIPFPAQTRHNFFGVLLKPRTGTSHHRVEMVEASEVEWSGMSRRGRWAAGRGTAVGAGPWPGCSVQMGVYTAWTWRKTGSSGGFIEPTFITQALIRGGWGFSVTLAQGPCRSGAHHGREQRVHRVHPPHSRRRRPGRPRAGRAIRAGDSPRGAGPAAGPAAYQPLRSPRRLPIGDGQLLRAGGRRPVRPGPARPVAAAAGRHDPAQADPAGAADTGRAGAIIGGRRCAIRSTW